MAKSVEQHKVEIEGKLKKEIEEKLKREISEQLKKEIGIRDAKIAELSNDLHNLKLTQS